MIGAKNIPKYFKLARLIVIDIGRSHFQQRSRNIRIERCFAKNFSEKIFGRIFQEASFPSTFYNVDEFSLGPVFIEPRDITFLVTFQQPQ